MKKRLFCSAIILFIMTACGQKETLQRLLERLKEDYPDARIVGHRDLPGVKKDCPCFDV